MKKLVNFLFVAILGGSIALGGYKLFLEKPVVIEKSVNDPFPMVKSNYVTPSFDENSTSTSFTLAAERSLNAVVHVKNRAVKTGVSSWADLFNGPRKYEQVGTGSGVIISSDGSISYSSIKSLTIHNHDTLFSSTNLTQPICPSFLILFLD